MADDSRPARTVRGGPRNERKGRTRQALLDVALELVSDRGFAGLSLREVAKGAGIVPTAFYRHFASMEDLGVTLVEESMRVLRALLRETRRDLDVDNIVATASSSLTLLLKFAEENALEFRFLIREQHGGVAEIRRAIDAELQLISSELAVDLSRVRSLKSWGTTELEIAADLIVTLMVHAVSRWIEVDSANHQLQQDIIEFTHKQMIMVFLGMGGWAAQG